MSGKLLLQMAGLPNEGKHKARGRIIAQNSQETQLEFDVSYRRVNDMLRFAEVSIDKLSVAEGSKIELEFVSSDDLKLVVPVSVFH